MQFKSMKVLMSAALVMGSLACAALKPVAAKPATNPIIWADVPDPAILRVGDTYYMSSTTMHMAPGLPIMKSKNLVDWNMASYAYQTLGDTPDLRLETQRSAYGRGSWASSLRYHDGLYYATTFSSTTGKTYIYTTKDIENGPWEEHSFRPSLHDSSLFFDDDGKVYMATGTGNIRLVELNPDLSGIKQGGFDGVVVPNASAVAGPNIMLQAEGSNLFKHDGKYYIMNITWPRGGMRTEIIHRADKVTGPYTEGKVIMQDQGIAQGGLVDTPDGKWYAILFQDHGSVGRIPYLIPARWEDGWPVLGVDGKVPMTLNIMDTEPGLGNIVADDEFNRKPGAPLPLAWQWNHNPDNEHWSIGERKGYLRLTTGRVDQDVLHSRNMLTQRTFGPVSSAETKLDVSGLKDGDTAGLIALQSHFGYVAARKTDGKTEIVMASVSQRDPQIVETVPLNQDTVYFKIDCDFRNKTDKAYFFYSLDGKDWKKIGNTLQMSYTLDQFMGYRFGLFDWASKTAGGHADFDFYHVTDKISEE